MKKIFIFLIVMLIVTGSTVYFAMKVNPTPKLEQVNVQQQKNKTVQILKLQQRKQMKSHKKINQHRVVHKITMLIKAITNQVIKHRRM